MRSLFPKTFILLCAALFSTAAAQTLPTTAPAAVSAEETKKIESALDQSYFVVVGKLEAPRPGAEWNGTVKTSLSILCMDKGQGDEFSLWFTDADGYKIGQEGVWFVARGDKKYAPVNGLGYLPLADKDKVVAVAEKWLERRIDMRIKAVPDMYKKDPDGDQEATWMAMAELIALGKSEIYFPTLKAKTTDHPSRGHLDDMYRALGSDLGVPPYVKTPADKEKAVATLKLSPDSMIQGAVTKADMTDENLDFAMRVFLYYHFSAIESTLALDAERYPFEKENWAKKLPAGTKPTRMAAFKMRLAELTTPAKPAQ